MRAWRLVVASLAASGLVTGCASMSGLDASDSFSCKAAPGVNCQSISGVYANANAGNLPFQRNGGANSKNAEAGVATDEKPVYGGSKPNAKVSPRDMNAAFSGMPVRQPPLVLRVWMAPYEDEAGDLHDQSYFYTMVHSGKWMIEANRNAITNQFRPIYPLTRQPQAEEAGTDKKGVQAQQKAQRLDNQFATEKPDIN